MMMMLDDSIITASDVWMCDFFRDSHSRRVFVFQDKNEFYGIRMDAANLRGLKNSFNWFPMWKSHKRGVNFASGQKRDA